MYPTQTVKLTFLVLLLVLGNCASGAEWTGAGVGDSWCTPENWDTHSAPGPAETASINPPPGRGPVIDCDVAVLSIEGPKWESNNDQVMDVTGGTVVINEEWRFANGGSGVATVNISGNPDITISWDLRASDTALDYAVFNISGGSVSCYNFLVGDDGGGEINMSGGSIEIAGNMDFGGWRGSADITVNMTGGSISIGGTLGAPAYAGGPGIVTINLDAGTIQCTSFTHGETAYAMDVEQGVFVVGGNVTADILADADAGYITAYDGEGTVHVELVGGNTVVTASEPDPNLASKPDPLKGAQDVSPNVMLSWTPGIAAAHDVYVGTNYNDVNGATDPNVSPGRGRQDSNSYLAPELLEFSTKYYWRVDEVSGTTVWKGRVWNFTTADGKAANPSPADGRSIVPQNTDLAWTPGALAVLHDVYFGTDFDSVNNANTSVTLDVYMGRQAAISFDPCGVLDLAATYYWRIDEVGDTTPVKGDVWSFTTAAVRIIGHSIVYGGPDIFCGWPANNGVYTWGDNEILVGFSYGPYVEKSGHNLGSPELASLGRSLDGGLTWTMEDPPNFVGDGGTTNPPPGGINFAHPHFAFRAAKEPEQFWFSYDRGHTWQGPYHFGDLMSEPELSGREFTSRTDYIVNGPDDCFIGMSATPGMSGSDVSFIAQTTDGGATFDFVSWIVPPTDPSRGVMPLTVRCSPTKLVTAVRRRTGGTCWVDSYVSYDNAGSWLFLSWVGDAGGWNGSPPALVRLRDGRLCCSYANRTAREIRARLSEDEGLTWGEEIVLRDDYQADVFNDPDLGYPRMVQRPDGKLVTMYYWATPEHPTHHIAATIWDVGGTPDPGKAVTPSPKDGAEDVPRDAVLGWVPGVYAVSHDVYFGTDFDEVNDADTTWAEYKGSQELGTDSYDPCGLLDLGRTYHWRIDEVNDANTWKGDVWSFATVNYLLVDDMESYNDSNNLIYETWHDWWWNGTGGVIAPGTEPEPVRGGAQSMRFSYDNDSMYSTKKYSETDRTFPGPQDWTAFEVKLLTLYFYGDPANDANDTEQMYAGVGDSRGAYAEVKYGDNGEDMNDIRIAEWQRWDVVLADFNDGGVALEDVNKVYIGFGERGNDTVPGGWGQVYFDDIRLCLPICVGPAPRADLSGDCVVDFVDLGIMTRRWLDEGELAADLYVDGKINLRDYAVFAESWLEDGRWP